MESVLSEKDFSKVKEIDKSVKNKFSFKWLEKTVTVGELTIRQCDDIRKLNLPGQAQS